MSQLSEFVDFIEDGSVVGVGAKVDAVSDADLSSFDATTSPPYITVRQGSRRKVTLRTTTPERPQRIDSSDDSVAGAKITDPGVTAQDFLGSEPVGPAVTGADVLITAKGHGTTMLTGIVPYQTWGTAQLEVDIVQRQSITLNLHFVTDKQGNKPWLDAAKVQQNLLEDVNDIYRWANIDFTKGRDRAIPVNLDFATKGQTAAQQRTIFETLWKLSRSFDNSPNHLNVWFVKEWGAADLPGADTRGTQWLGTGIALVEDEPNWARAALTLAHELGHALGMPHSNNRGGLMFPTLQGGGRKLFKDDYRKIVLL